MENRYSLVSFYVAFLSDSLDMYLLLLNIVMLLYFICNKKPDEFFTA